MFFKRQEYTTKYKTKIFLKNKEHNNVKKPTIQLSQTQKLFRIHASLTNQTASYTLCHYD